MEMLKEILTSNGGAFAVVFAVLYAVGQLLMKFSEWRVKAEEVAKKGEKFEDKVDAIMSDMHYIKGTLDLLKNGMPNALTQAHSPVSLTPKGKEVADQMGVAEMVARNWDKIETLIDAKVVFKNAYDIQQFCIEKATVALESFFCAQDVNNIKKFAYDNGQPLALYGSMIGVIIRDKYFEVKKIPLEKVDETDPNK